MKIRLSELRNVIQSVLREMHDDENGPLTQRSPDTTRTFHPDTLAMMNDAEPETEVPPGTQASVGMEPKTMSPDDEINDWLRGDEDEEDMMASTQMAPTMAAPRREVSPHTVRSPR